MSLTKNNPAFDRMMEEARMDLDNSHELYLEELYLRESVKATKEPTQVTPPQGTNTQAQDGTRK